MFKKGLGYVFAVLAFVAAPLANSANAQEVGRVEQTTATAPHYYNYVQPGMPTIQVQIIGAVHSPGLYEVNESTSFGQVLALAGGPQLQARTRNTKRRIRVRLIRPSSGSYEPLYDSELDDGAIYAGPFPPLREQDIIRVEVVDRLLFSWRDALQIVTTAASLYLVFDRTRD